LRNVQLTRRDVHVAATGDGEKMADASGLPVELDAVHASSNAI